jgi:iron complex outermembrane recepter protein
LTGLVAASLLCGATAAKADDAPRRFSIPPEPLTSALLDFAVQARVSISTTGAKSCRPAVRQLNGRFRLREGLAQLLAGTGCGFDVTREGDVRIYRLPEPAPAAEPIRAAPNPPVAPPPSPTELIVTSGRRSALIDRAPYAVSAIRPEDVLAPGLADIGDITDLVAGLSTTDLGPGRDKIFIRGLSDSALTGATQSTVGVYLDGARITYDAPDPDLALVDVDRVEVLRGPQGALYGAGSIGGLLLIVTRKPGLDSYAAQVDAGLSATVGGAPGRSIDVMANLPLVSGAAGLRLVGYDEVQGGYIDDVRIGVRNANQVRRRGVRATARWQVSPDWQLTANVTRQWLNSADTHYAEPTVGEYARANLVREPHDNDFLAAGLTLEGHKDWGDLTVTSSVLRHQYNSRYDASLALPLFAPGAPILPSPFQDNHTAELLVNEVSVASPDRGRVRWLAGLFQSVGDNDSSSVLSAPLGPGGNPVVAYDEFRHDVVRELAGYGQVSYFLTPQLSVTAGGRAFRASVKTQSHIEAPQSGTASAFVGKTRSSGFAPQIVLRYAPDPDLTLYVQASEGYRAPGFNTAGQPGQSFAAPGAAGEPPRRYVGDELWNYEAGAKIRLFGGAAQLRASAFYMLWKRVQSDQLLPDGLVYVANIGDARDFGLEGEFEMQAGEHWRLAANATIAEPELVHPSPDFVSRPDNGLPGAAKVSAGASATYERPLTSRIALKLQGLYAYVGGSHLTLDATTSPPMGDYSRGELSAGLVGADWSLSAFVASPIGGTGDTFAYGNPFAFRTVPQTTPLRPMTLGLKVTARTP